MSYSVPSKNTTTNHPMKIQILSDLHIEFIPFSMEKTDADVVVLAGDIHVGNKGVRWAIQNIRECPVIYVLGNHEFYGKSYPNLFKKLKLEAEGSNVFVLEKESFWLDDVLFLGCTLWTDFELFDNYQSAIHHASISMTDFRKIRVSPKYSKLKPRDTAVFHHKAKRWLEAEIKKKQEKLVIVTHHAPSMKSIPLKYSDDALSPAYASNLEHLVAESNADLWIHGHVHQSLNYRILSTKVVCNPRGYPDELNSDFNPALIVEI